MLRAGDSSKEVLALVDSGARRSLFPLHVAVDLGIRDELVPCADAGEGANRERFDLFDSPVPVTVQVIREVRDGPKEPWGPEVELDAAFSEKASFLLGVSDFFDAFDIEFMRGRDQSRFFLHAL